MTARRATAKIVKPDDGIPCPRCGQPTEVRERATITRRQQRQSFHFRVWFFCRNPECKTSTISRPEDTMCRDIDDDVQERLDDIIEQLRVRR